MTFLDDFLGSFLGHFLESFFGVCRGGRKHTPPLTSASASSRGACIISCTGRGETHAAADFGRRIEQSWPYYFEHGEKRNTRHQ